MTRSRPRRSSSARDGRPPRDAAARQHPPAARGPCGRRHQVRPRRRGHELGAFDHRADLHRAHRGAAAVTARDPVDAAHADRRAEDPGAQGEVQGGPAALPAGDDGALQEGGGQPVLLVPTVHPADPLLHRDLPAAERGHVPGRRGGQPAGFLFVKSVIESPHGAELIVLIVLFVTTTAASVLLTTATSPTASPAQRYLMLLFPLIIVPFIINAPAGLAVYWIATNLFSLGQQWVVQKLIPAPIPPTPEEVKTTKPPPPPPRKKKRRRR